MNASSGPGRVLLATDLSETSWAALPAALDLVNRLGAKLDVIHVVPISRYLTDLNPYGGINPRIDVDKLREESMAFARKSIEEKLAPFDVAYGVAVFEAADVPRALVEFADEGEPAWIVIATHGHTGVKRLLLGSVTEKVVRLAHVPVVVVPCHD